MPKSDILQRIPKIQVKFQLGVEKFKPMHFIEAKSWIKDLKLKGERDWRKYLKGGYPDKPKLLTNIPSTPYKVYKDEWKGFRDWLGIIT